MLTDADKKWLESKLVTKDHLSVELKKLRADLIGEDAKLFQDVIERVRAEHLKT